MKAIRYVLLAVLALLAVSAQLTAAEAKTKFNLLIITADDMNADSPGWMGNPLKLTPNVDALAKTSHQFVNNHVTVPICQPGRQAIMTGRVPHRNGGTGFNPINLDVPTLVEVLKEQGYYTAAINKTQHMAPKEKFPWDHPFDGSGKNPKLFRSQMEEALAEAKKAGKPFFINANITDPHRPFYGSAQGEQKKAKKGKAGNEGKAVKKSGEDVVEPLKAEQVSVPKFLEDVPLVREEMAQYYTSIKRLDVTFGEVMAALKASGQEDNTVVMFMSDHGISTPFSKASVYFNGTRSPVLMRWPGMGKPQKREEFVSSVDVMPTLLDVLSVKHPAGMDGRSWLPLLKGEKQEGRDYVITHVNSVSSGKDLPQRCIRTKDYALMFHAWSDGKTSFRVEAMNGLTFNALAEAGKTDGKIQSRVEQFIKGTPIAFYDLKNDPEERTNELTNPKFQKEIERMKKLLQEHMEKTKDPQLEAFKKAAMM
ncbi:MAG TPA: sulfatase [Verrucomicrobiae bacterium]